MKQELNVGDKVFAVNNQYVRITSETDPSEIVYTVVGFVQGEVVATPSIFPAYKRHWDDTINDKCILCENGLDDSSTPAEEPNSVVSCYGGLSSVACGFSL